MAWYGIVNRTSLLLSQSFTPYRERITLGATSAIEASHICCLNRRPCLQHIQHGIQRPGFCASHPCHYEQGWLKSAETKKMCWDIHRKHELRRLTSTSMYWWWWWWWWWWFRLYCSKNTPRRCYVGWLCTAPQAWRSTSSESPVKRSKHDLELDDAHDTPQFGTSSKYIIWRHKEKPGPNAMGQWT